MIAFLGMSSRSTEGRSTTSRIPCRLVTPIAAAVAVAILLNVALCEASARGRHHKSSAAAAAAKKKQMIDTVQKQLAVARRVLAQAESQASFSGQELAAAKKELDAARDEIEAAGSEERQAREERRNIESKLLADQGPESPLGKAQSAVDEAYLAVDRELHRAVSLPEHGDKLTVADRSADASLLSADDKEALQSDAQFQAARDKLAAAKRSVTQARQDLLTNSPEWTAATKALTEAHEKETDLKQDANPEAARVVSKKRDLRTAEEVAAAARMTIARGEAMLRNLGVKDVGSTPKSTSQPKK